MILGIVTSKQLAEDVHHDHLNFLLSHHIEDPDRMQATLINSKGFGGNNATRRCCLLGHEANARSDTVKLPYARMLRAMSRLPSKPSPTTKHVRGENHVIYQFGEGVIEGPALGINSETIHIPGLDQPINLSVPNPYEDMSCISESHESEHRASVPPSVID